MFHRIWSESVLEVDKRVLFVQVAHGLTEES